MKVLGDGFSKSMFFAREGIECTENDIRGRKNEAAVSQKGTKFFYFKSTRYIFLSISTMSVSMEACSMSVCHENGAQLGESQTI